MLIRKTLIAAAALAMAGAASANPLANGSFESGTLAGWTPSAGSASLITTQSNDVAPGWGSLAAQLTAGRGTGLYTYLYQNKIQDKNKNKNQNQSNTSIPRQGRGYSSCGSPKL